MAVSLELGVSVYQFDVCEKKECFDRTAEITYPGVILAHPGLFTKSSRNYQIPPGKARPLRVNEVKIDTGAHSTVIPWNLIKNMGLENHHVGTKQFYLANGETTTGFLYMMDLRSDLVGPYQTFLVVGFPKRTNKPILAGMDFWLYLVWQLHREGKLPALPLTRQLGLEVKAIAPFSYGINVDI